MYWYYFLQWIYYIIKLCYTIRNLWCQYMTKVVAKVQPLTQSQKYFLTAAFILISLIYFLVVWYWFSNELVTPQSSQIGEITTQIFAKKSLTTPLESPVIYQFGEYAPKTEFNYPNPLHYIAILVTAGLFGLLNIQLIGTMLITMSILFLTWKLSEELTLHLDTRGDESLFFIKVLVWIASLAFFSSYWTPWFSPQLLYTMLILAALYNMFRFYRLRSYPDAALAFIWLIFSMVVSTEAVQIGAIIWNVWMLQFILLSRKAKVFRRSIFLLSISAIVIGAYWTYVATNFELNIDLTQSSGFQLKDMTSQSISPDIQKILNQVEQSEDIKQINQTSYVRYPLLVMLGLGSAYILYKRRSAGFFMTVAMLSGLILMSEIEQIGLGNMPFLAPYVIFLTIVVSLRIFRRVPEIHRFSLSGFFLSMIFLFIFPSMDRVNTQPLEEISQVTNILLEVDPERQTIFSEYAIPKVTTVYDPRFQYIADSEAQIYVWDNLYQANYWLVFKDEETQDTGTGIKDLQSAEYFEKITETEEWILYQRTITTQDESFIFSTHV